MKIYEENYIHTQDIALNVASYEKKSNNINILFVHGFLERWQSWEQTMSFLPKHYNLFAVDLRGFGRSGKTLINHKRSTWAKDISDLVNILNKERMILVGHSLGGPIVSSVAKTNKISNVILEDPFLGSQVVDKTGRAQRGKLVAEIIDNSKSLNEAIKELKELRPDWRNDIPIEIATARKFTDRFLLQVPRKFDDDFSIEEVYKNIPCRTILNNSNPSLGGINSPDEIKEIKKLNKLIEINDWQGSGHNIHRDFPKKFAHEIVKFIENFDG